MKTICLPSLKRSDLIIYGLFLYNSVSLNLFLSTKSSWKFKDGLTMIDSWEVLYPTEGISTLEDLSVLFAMSIITVQLGQCGNQIGGQLFHTFMEDVHSKPLATQVSARQLTEVFGCRSSPEAFSAEQVLASAYQNFCCRYTEFCRELKSTGPAEHTSESGNRSIYLQI